MKTIITFALLLLAGNAVAQNITNLQDPVSSRMFNTEKYSGIRGTPFLVDKWLQGTATTPNGVYQNLELKYNVYDNTIFFNKDDNTFELVDNIVAFTLMPKPGDTKSYLNYRKGLTGPDFKEKQFVQVLFDGPNASVYKLDQKLVSEMSEINAGMVKTFANGSKYYIARKGQIVGVKFSSAEEIMTALVDKQAQLQRFIVDKKLNFKKDTDLVELVKYYNTL
jgi:hypothetical protein